MGDWSTLITLSKNSRPSKRVVDQCALARAGNASDACEQADRDLRIDVLEIISCGAANLQLSQSVRRRAFLGDGDDTTAGQIVAGQRFRIGGDLFRCSLGDDVAFIPGHGPMSTFGFERRVNPFVGDGA